MDQHSITTLQNLAGACQVEATTLTEQAHQRTYRWSRWAEPLTDTLPIGEDPAYDDNYQRICEGATNSQVLIPPSSARWQKSYWPG